MILCTCTPVFSEELHDTHLCSVRNCMILCTCTPVFSEELHDTVYMHTCVQ